MYNVSDAFKEAVKKPSRKSTITGTLKTAAGTTYILNDASFIKDSFYVTNQCVNNNALEVGTVYAGEVGMIINSNIDRYSLFGAEIKCNFNLWLEDGSVESLPLGIYYVDTAERTGSKIKLTAIDNMSKLDIDVLDDTNGSWYSLLELVANKADIELAQTQEELEALHINATMQTYTVKTAKVATYRDLLSYLCSVICAFATIDNMGKLKIKQWSTVADASNDTDSRLANCNFSDYTTNYCGVTARFFKEENFYPYTSVDENIDGLLLDMGDIPIVGGTSKLKKETLNNMLDTIKQIIYVPSTLYIASNPALELGDMIECNNVNNSTDTVNTLYMKYKYEYRKKETVNCYGENPLLQSVKDRTRRQIESLENSVEDKDVVLITYSNAEAYKVAQNLVCVARLDYAIASACRPIVLASIPFSIDVDGYVEFNIYNSLVALENATYRGYYEAGEHFATIFYLDECAEGDRKSLRIFAKCYADTKSAIRTQGAELATYNNALTALKAVTSIEDINNLEYDIAKADTTDPTVTIKTADIRAIAYAQGIATGVNWDGTLEFKDNFKNDIVLGATNVLPFGITVGTSQLTPERRGLAETISNTPVSTVIVDGLSSLRTWGAYTNESWWDVSVYTWQEMKRR